LCSILDVIKTRVQTQDIITTIATTTTNTQRPAAIVSSLAEQTRLLDAAAAASSSSSSSSTESRRLGAIQIAKQAYRQQGLSVFFRGLGVCSVRAFFVNAVQWAVYEWMMHVLLKTTSPR
jgi:solute carrier family 25 carnitine/acylcarnitine transporter 20/29